MNFNLSILLVFFVLVVVSRKSGASFPESIWNLRFRSALLKDSHQSLSPSPGPSPVPIRKTSGGTTKTSPTPAIPPISNSANGFTAERCNSSFQTCSDLMNMTACLLIFEHVKVEQYLLIQNDGETSLKVNVIISGDKYKEVQIPDHHAKKVNISDVLGAPLIILDSGNGKCLINVESTENGGISKQFTSYVTHVNLVSGSLLLFSIALVIGGVWACCKMGRERRQADGVPYQELELAEHDTPPVNDLEAAEGWDQGWEDDWDDDELKHENKSSEHVQENGSSNGINSNLSHQDGWGNNWDD